jgi:hypothetical protein
MILATEIKGELWVKASDLYQISSAQVVPDAIGPDEGETEQYIQGWNDCRQLMLQTRNNRNDL